MNTHSDEQLVEIYTKWPAGNKDVARERVKCFVSKIFVNLNIEKSCYY